MFLISALQWSFASLNITDQKTADTMQRPLSIIHFDYAMEEFLKGRRFLDFLTKLQFSCDSSYSAS